mmetsp:Transcript_22196/g.28982  ORF Transcript_22196/g.28982 Transcript_22196/m.28982 type:complete len:456 (-) Transcript_22196:176-1543(-)
MTEFNNHDDDYVTNFNQFSGETEDSIDDDSKQAEFKQVEAKEIEAKEVPIAEAKHTIQPTMVNKVDNMNSSDNSTSTTSIKTNFILENEYVQKIFENEHVQMVFSFAKKYGCRTNFLNGTLVGCFLLILFFMFIRYCSFKYFIGILFFPFSYAFFGSRTFALGSLKGKVVLVTGASSGLGRGLAISAAKMGAKKVILVARSTAGLSTTSTLISELSTNCEVESISCDVTNPTQVDDLAKTCFNNKNSVNLLINCAGSGDWKPIVKTTPEEAASNIACPYLAAFNVTRAFLPSFYDAKKVGADVHIMNVTSVAAYTSWKGSATYGSARWAVRGFTEYTRCEVKDQKIGVTLLNPGQIRGTEYAVNNQIDFDHLPWIFAKGYNNPRAYDCEAVSSRALQGCIDGECEVHVPGLSAHPVTWFTAFAPSVVWFITDLKPFWVNKDDKKETSSMESKKDN